VREHHTGNIVVLEVVWKGIHSGPLDMPTGTIPASNGALDMPSCQVFEIKDGKVATFTQYFDLLTMLRQIGAA
jgi:ketosteroid isomerase-like protein